MLPTQMSASANGATVSVLEVYGMTVSMSCECLFESSGESRDHVVRDAIGRHPLPAVQFGRVEGDALLVVPKVTAVEQPKHLVAFGQRDESSSRLPPILAPSSRTEPESLFAVVLRPRR